MMSLYYFSVLSFATTLLAMNCYSQAVITSDKPEEGGTNLSMPMMKKEEKDGSHTNFSADQKKQLQDMKDMDTNKREQFLLSSPDWYTRNHAHCAIALLRRTKERSEESLNLILEAHKDQYAPASLELAKIAAEKENGKALTYFRVALTHFTKTKDQVPDETNLEFAKSLINFARLNGALEILEEFSKDEPLLVYSPKEQRKESALEPDKDEGFDDLEVPDSAPLTLMMKTLSDSSEESEDDFMAGFDSVSDDI